MRRSLKTSKRKRVIFHRCWPSPKDRRRWKANARAAKIIGTLLHEKVAAMSPEELETWLRSVDESLPPYRGIQGLNPELLIYDPRPFLGPDYYTIP